MWTPRVRQTDLTLTAPLLFTQLTLVERYGPPDTLVIEGDIEDLRPAFQPDSGIVLWDADGVQRFSGVPPQHPKTKVERRGDGTATLTYEADTVHLWDRFSWPTPANAWNNQTSAYDVQTAVEETRIIDYIDRNAGGLAYNSGTFDRRVPNLILPTSLGRGVSGKTSARFQNLGQLVAELAEAASLRVTIRHDSSGPALQLVVDSLPDYSAWARFGDGPHGGLALLGRDWRYALGPGPSVILSAAGGEEENRLLTSAQDVDREALAGRHIEHFIDQRGTEDAGEIAQGIDNAWAETAPTVEVSAPIIAGQLRFGPSPGAIPVGAKVSVALDGEPVVDRLRELTTVVSAGSEGTEVVTPVFGTADQSLTLDQKALRRALARLAAKERQ